jgi:hypothetical protein
MAASSEVVVPFDEGFIVCISIFSGLKLSSLNLTIGAGFAE